jgi:hypothetical protein
MTLPCAKLVVSAEGAVIKFPVGVVFEGGVTVTVFRQAEEMVHVEVSPLEFPEVQNLFFGRQLAVLYTLATNSIFREAPVIVILLVAKLKL